MVFPDLVDHCPCAQYAWCSMHCRFGCVVLIGCQFAVYLVCGWYFAVMGNVLMLQQCPFTMLVFSFCPCVMLVMLGGLAGFCHELQPHSAPLCICLTALPLSHCLALSHCLLALGVPWAPQPALPVTQSLRQLLFTIGGLCLQ